MNKIFTFNLQKTNAFTNIFIISTVFMLIRFHCSQQLIYLTVCSQWKTLDSGKTLDSQWKYVLECFVPPSGQLGCNV